VFCNDVQHIYIFGVWAVWSVGVYFVCVCVLGGGTRAIGRHRLVNEVSS